MPINQMTKNKDRPHSYVFAQVGRGIIWESALLVRKPDPTRRARLRWGHGTGDQMIVPSQAPDRR